MFDFLKEVDCQKLLAVKKKFEGGERQIVMGLNSFAAGFFIGTMGRGGALVAKDLVSSGKIAAQLSGFGFNVKFLTGTFENSLGLIDENLRDDFYAALGDLCLQKIDFLIAMPNALFQKIPSKAVFLKNIISLCKNQTLDMSNLIKRLVEVGYHRTDGVYARGDFSVKGDTILLAPIGCENLLRIEFFDDIIEKLSLLSFDDKKFVSAPQTFDILPRELPAENANILSYVDKVFIDEPAQIESALETFDHAENFLPQSDVFADLPKSAIAFANIVKDTFFKADSYAHFSAENGKNYLYNFKELADDLKVFAGGGKEIYFFCKTAENAKRLNTFLEENFVFAQSISGAPTHIHIVEDFLPYTVHLHDANAIFFGTYNLFAKEKTTKTAKKAKLFIPKVNEFVVHDVHGIGKCVGIEKLALAGFEKDYIIIEYAGGDRFYLPSEQADALSLYSTNEESPKLNKLGGADFARVKEKVYKSVKEMAFDLLKLYAAREKAKGVVYAKDDYLSEQFDDAFPFEETPDQLRAIADIKADMESTKIMDRLVCGDVGFGKTEVALRAIYKAVLSGKQVAFLCPTTVLAQQHYQTCQKRFSGFMVKTARFNRLMTKSEEAKVLAGLADGTIDVVCGTHKLLSNKVAFKNLSLLVLDEEQRFGVEDKEKIKNLKNNIDVLSLSATPIPRTLHMSLTGIRDISIIDTPPRQRLPVQTFVTEFDEGLIQRAIETELARDGQVLIIYNNIEKIFDFAAKIKNLVPNAKIGVAHGRLSQKVLEDTIIKLYAKEYQILVSTTLIENGIDLPSANTLIVIDADKLGLSQAYQIRGRVGRGDKPAFAYFLIKEGKQVSENAYRRLSALMENTSLGSGLKIAMADLDIRGAGNVLGKQQSGNMMKVGYDLYYKLLNVALKELKGEKVVALRDVKIIIALDAYVPEWFVESEDDRLKLITEISALENQKSAQEFLHNLESTLGKVPNEVQNLAKISVLKNLCQKVGARQVQVNEDGFKLYFYEKNDLIFSQKATILQNLNHLLADLEKQIPQNS